MFGLPNFINITIEYIYFCYGLDVSEITTSMFLFFGVGAEEGREDQALAKSFGDKVNLAKH